ncbi:response regulator [Breoghania sp. L-A4]|uniref:response regulator n=1 Tax=Breoghania sp. L-A4 TaxID=2304600 RepID=UPI000E35F05C|nr:response regulator [Breoghania sp. L-A4]AXS39907.1 response regulator [Breoghania sp. L-A4]
MRADAVVLLVEDNIIFSLDAEDMLRRLGVAAVVTCDQAKAAIDVIDSQAIDFAVLDINLGTETSLPVAEHLRAARIPFVFVSDFDDPAVVPPEFGDVPVLAKPYTMEGLGRIFSL